MGRKGKGGERGMGVGKRRERKGGEDIGELRKEQRGGKGRGKGTTAYISFEKLYVKIGSAVYCLRGSARIRTKKI